MDDDTATLVVEGQSYALAGLPQVARDTLTLLQLVEPRHQQLKVEIAVCQTANVTYTSALRAERDQLISKQPE